MEHKTKRLECKDLWAIYLKPKQGPIERHVMGCSFSRPLLEAMLAERREKDSLHPINQDSLLSIGAIYRCTTTLLSRIVLAMAC